MRRLLLVSVLLCFGLCGCGDQSSTDPRVREILSAPVPEGINPVVWRELTEKLAAVVESRRTSIPPTNSASATTLTYDDANGVLHWPYYFSGDYDQNGVVSVSDLTPLAVNLGASVTDANSITGVIDGDGNGEITVADLTPIGVNLGKTVQGYRVYSASSAAPYPATPTAPNGTGTQLAGEVLLAQATGNKATQRLQFSFDPPAPTAQTWYWVRPFDGSDDGTPSTLVMIAPGGNPAPFAAISASPSTGATPLRVQLIASASHDEAPGQIVKYEWDLDGDGDFEYDSGISDSTPMWYYAPGTFSAAVRVTDDSGLSSVQDVEVEVTLGKSWQVTEVDDTITDEGCHLLNADGNPALVYNKEGVQPGVKNLIYRRAGNAAGTSWSQRVVLDEVGAYDHQTVSASVVDGKPALFYSNVNPLELRLLTAANSTGAAWNPVQVVDTLTIPQGSAEYSKITQVGNGIGLLINEDIQGRLRWCRSQDLLGEEWVEPVQLAAGVKQHDLALINGLPAVAMYISSGSVEALAYLGAYDQTGGSWQPPVILDYVGVAGRVPQIVEAGGRPAVAYYDQVFQALKFVRAIDIKGTEWEQPQFLAYGTSEVQSMEILLDGRPAIVYVTPSGAELRFMAANDPAGTTWCASVLVDHNINTQWSQIAVSFVGEKLHVGYLSPYGNLDPSNGKVKFAAYN